MDQSSPDFFVERGRNRCRSHVFPIWDIFVRSGEIRDLSLTLSEIEPNVARFWPPKNVVEKLPNFSAWIIKLKQLSITYEKLTAIDQGSSEISR